MTSVNHASSFPEPCVSPLSLLKCDETNNEGADITSLSSGSSASASLISNKCVDKLGSIVVSLVPNHKRKYLSLPDGNSEKILTQEIENDHVQLLKACQISRNVISYEKCKKIRSWLFDVDIFLLGLPEWAKTEQALDDDWEQQSLETDERENSSEAHESGCCSTSESEFRSMFKSQKLAEHAEVVLRKLSETWVSGLKCGCSIECTTLRLDSSSNVLWECQSCDTFWEIDSKTLVSQKTWNLPTSVAKSRAPSGILPEMGFPLMCGLTHKAQTESELAATKEVHVSHANSKDSRRFLKRLLYTLISNRELRIHNYESQVAGHYCNVPGEGLLIMEDEAPTSKSYILKPIQDLKKYWKEDGRGYNDQEFLRFCAQNLNSFPLARYVPRIYGCLDYNEQMYCILEDLTWGYIHPCIADIKVGRNDFTPFVHAKKQQNRRARYPNQYSIGFRICGMKVYDSVEYVTYGKQWCSQNTDMPGLRRCFRLLFPKGQVRGSMLQTVIKKLESIMKNIEHQRIFNFISSSILIVYEGASDEECERREVENVVRQRACTVRLIDFGNVYECTEVDENSLYGFRMLLDTLNDFSLEHWEKSDIF